MKKELLLKNGRKVKLDRLERPQLLIDDEGNPEVIYRAASLVPVSNRHDGVSFNARIPLKYSLLRKKN